MNLAEELRALLGNDAVSDEAAELQAHGGDKWIANHPPEVVVFAKSTEQVSKLLRFASEKKIPVTARGAGYGYVGGCVPVRGGIALSLARMNRIKEINFADAIAIVEPGVITADLQAKAREQKLFYPPDPASMKDCTIGGNVATNAGGPRCLKYGVTRNYVIGLEVVLASGEVLRTGGRVHKNKTGFDLIGLFVGSEGMLGVVTEITVRLLPLPPARATLSAAFATMTETAATVQAIFQAGFLPAALEIADHFTLEAARRDKGVARCAGRERAFAGRGGWPGGNGAERSGGAGEIDRGPESEFARDRDDGGGMRKPVGVAPRLQQLAARHRPDEAERGYRGAAVAPGRADRVRRSASEAARFSDRLFWSCGRREHPREYHGGGLRGARGAEESGARAGRIVSRRCWRGAA